MVILPESLKAMRQAAYAAAGSEAHKHVRPACGPLSHSSQDGVRELERLTK